MRIILFTGKGGTGKTTCAAATAMKTAAEGLRTLIISTDSAHSLADALDIKLGPEPVKAAENLYAQELDIYYSMRKYWGNLSNMLRQVFSWQGMDRMLVEEMAALPGMAEAAAFLWVDKYYTEGEYDVLVIDSAPTGETLTLLSLPQVSRWWTSKLFPYPKMATKAFGAFVHAATGIPLDESYRELEELFSKLEKLYQIFSNPLITSVRVVTNPEKMAVQEAKRVYTYLLLYGYSVDAVIVNRVLPDASADSFWGRYLEAQKHYLEDIATSFYPLPVLTIDHAGAEVFGMEMLRGLGDGLYAGQSPAALLYSEKSFIIEDVGEVVRLKLRLPFFENNDFRIEQFGDELVINIRNNRRNLFLPRFMGHFAIRDYYYEDPNLVVLFSRIASSES